MIIGTIKDETNFLKNILFIQPRSILCFGETIGHEPYFAFQVTALCRGRRLEL